MKPGQMEIMLKELKEALEGDLFIDQDWRLMYATDASAYREVPLAVVRPRSTADIKKLVKFANAHNVPLIPRAAGTSLAGQVVGKGIVVDISKYMNSILEINEEERWVRVEPGVVLDELNKVLAERGLFFGPETSTSNRCMIGGMIGNNSCGAHSLIYGSTRDHTLSVKAILSDGSEVEFKQLDREEFQNKCIGPTLESRIYSNIREILSDPENRAEITKNFPDPSIERRNTGYALDILMDSEPFEKGAGPFNFSKLLAGSEGTLAFITEARLNLVTKPPDLKALVCVHFRSLEEALQGNLIALRHGPGAVELMDKYILDCTRENISQQKNRFFLEGDPAAILIIELARESEEELSDSVSKIIHDLEEANLGYAFPVIRGNDIPKVWALRKAGLGVLSNVPGDAKPVSVIEDTAVTPQKLPGYISEFKKVLEKYGLECVYHAHIGTGELHLRPVLNLKDPKDVTIFRKLAEDIALLVKKHSGSLSGEHGDGRLRGEFIPLVIGDKSYDLLKKIKQAWDPGNIFNPGKIVDTPAMDTSLRYEPGRKEPVLETYFNFSRDGGILRAAEKCNGSGDCRKSEIIGGTMCPSFMATRDENTTTRARANILREYLTNSDRKNRFNHDEIREVMDLCLSCKGCKSECPSNVDIAKYKAEFLQHYYDANGVPLRSLLIANITSMNKIGSLAPGIFNFFSSSRWIKGILGFATERTVPPLSRIRLSKWHHKHRQTAKGRKKVYLFSDEFTEYNDSHIGISAIRLLEELDYEVIIPKHLESGRTHLSKGLVRKAAEIARKNVLLLKDKVCEDIPLVGIEPSAILSFRDEYPDLVPEHLRNDAVKLSRSCLTIEEFLYREHIEGRITENRFTDRKVHILLHGHCHQKALSSTGPTLKLLTIPSNYSAEEIPSGCCGMAGAFGYEKEHYELSMKVGELVLFPSIREAGEEVLLAAPGTSCRHQIKDGTGRKAMHPVEILFDALR